jgi:hypothetical protein
MTALLLALILALSPATTGGWHLERSVSFYGPGGEYGRRTACGLTLTTRTLGVAHRTLPCGTLVQFRYRNPGDGLTRTITVPVIDRGPARWTGRNWDLTGWTCVKLVGSRGRCWTLQWVWWRLVRA